MLGADQVSSAQVCREAWSALNQRCDQEAAMLARELARPVPTLRLDDPATEVGQLLATEAAGVVFLADPGGRLVGVVTDAGLLWYLLPPYLHQDPALAGVLGEAAADSLRDRLAGRTAGDLLVTAYRDVPEIGGDANLIEVAALLVRTRAPVAAVREAGRLLGGITTSALLTHLLGDAS
jgi:CBS domain-containing protein